MKGVTVQRRLVGARLTGRDKPVPYRSRLVGAGLVPARVWGHTDRAGDHKGRAGDHKGRAGDHKGRPYGVLLFTVLGMSASALAGEIEPNYANVDTERWRCRLCPFELANPNQATWTVGAIQVKDAHARFGRDNGLTEAGAQADGSLSYLRRGEDARAIAISARRLGLDSRAVGIEVKGNRISLRLDRREIPRNVATDGRTPFKGALTLTLPDDWVAGYDTADMTRLDEAVPFDHATERRRTTIQVRADPAPEWWVQAGYSRDTKTGTDETFADFVHQSTGLPRDVSFVTDEFRTSAGLERDSFTVAAELRNSRFRNRNRALQWQNPWRGPRVAHGRMGRTPDSNAHSLTLVSSAAIGNRTTAHGTLTWGDARQDDAFEPYTTNTRLVLDPLPANSLDGRARSFAGTLHLVSRPTDRLRLTLRHRHRERDNQTAVRTFLPVRGEAFRLGPVTSRAYDMERSTTQLGLDYRLTTWVGFGLYGDAARLRRVPAELSSNEERRYRIELTVGHRLGLRGRLSVEDADRDTSAFRDTTSNNPLTRRYHQAARDQRIWRATLGYEFPAGASAQFTAECRHDAYPASALGLERDRGCTRGADIAFAPAPNIAVAAFYLDQDANSATRGRVGFSGPEWRYATTDDTDTAGVRFDVDDLLDGRLEITVDVVASWGAGRYTTETAGESLPFPDLVSNLTSIDAHARYRLRNTGTLVFQLRHERYDGEDWARVEGLDAIRNVVAFGNASPRYANTLVGVSFELAIGR